MSDPMGTRASNYDLSHDLDNLWREALNAIHLMATGASERARAARVRVRGDRRGLRRRVQEGAAGAAAPPHPLAEHHLLSAAERARWSPL